MSKNLCNEFEAEHDLDKVYQQKKAVVRKHTYINTLAHTHAHVEVKYILKHKQLSLI